MAAECLHTTAYQFLDIVPDEALRRKLAAACTELQLVGNLTLAPEGLNLSLAGAPDAVPQLERLLLEDTPFTQLRFRHSRVARRPFAKLLVQTRPALLPVRLETPVTRRRPGAHLPPWQLRQWLDERRPLRLLDVRNAYEVQLGRFAGADALPLQQFRDFEASAQQLRPAAAPLVTYCTGGIRCEVASAWLRTQGHPEVWQLSGGILHYFEQCGGRHWQGECFVFDDRLAVDSRLRATYPRLCRTCQKPVADMRRQRCTACGDAPVGTD